MKTIARNATRKIAAVQAAVTHATMYSQSQGVMVPVVHLDRMWDDLTTYDFARLVDNENGTYNINVHGNLWYVLHTVPAIDFVEVGRQARRDGEGNAPALNKTVKAAFANMVVGTGATQIMQDFQNGWTEAAEAEEGSDRFGYAVADREPVVFVQRRADAGLPAWENCDGSVFYGDDEIVENVTIKAGQLPAVTVETTRKSVGTQLRERFAALCLSFEIVQKQGVQGYWIEGQFLTPGQAADKYLAGGFTEAFGGR